MPFWTVVLRFGLYMCAVLVLTEAVTSVKSSDIHNRHLRQTDDLLVTHVCNPPPLETRHLSSIRVNEREPIFALYPDPLEWKTFVSDEFYEIFHEILIKEFGWLVYSDNIPHVDVLLFIMPFTPFTYPESTFDMIIRLKKSQKASHFALYSDDPWSHSHKWYREKHDIFSLPFLKLLMTAAPNFKVFFPGIDKVPLWVPHASSKRFFHKVNASAERKVLLSGSLSKRFYPYRAQAATLLKKGNPNLARIQHPGYHNLAPNSSFHSDYVSNVSLYAAGLTCGLVMNCITAKTMEIPAMGQLLLVNHELETQLKRLCLYGDMHYMTYSKNTMEKTIEAATGMEYQETNFHMREAAQSVVMKMHTTEARAQLITKIALALTEQRPAKGFFYQNDDAGPILSPEIAYWQKKLSTEVCENEKLCQWKVASLEYKNKRTKNFFGALHNKLF